MTQTQPVVATLADFLLARIADDERRWDTPDFEEDSDSVRSPGWGNRGDQCHLCGRYMHDGTEDVTDQAWDEHLDSDHWPNRARVLTDCEAKRRIVAHHGREADPEGEDAGDLCAICTEIGPDAQGWPCLTLRMLALPYADHRDYRDEWRP